ncbi:DNA cytosine methyltransferase [Streptomyces megasporus]|uniref:DNA cytosine methyltransferase n=1 Tax=Streptomyces megasporus TaxID=44060 RepID=UPI00055A94D6|nr:DNA cytosine methyltransferase [Streptomyces megasporus]
MPPHSGLDFPDVDLTDAFCGGGGSSEGAREAGVRVRVALNHWPLAIKVHSVNHPDAAHDCADLSQVDPRRYPTTVMAWFSPSCTNHTIARGRRRHVDATLDLFGEVLPDAAADRSRATMWDVVRFSEYHRYRIVLVENVVDVREWILWPAWIAAMVALGYRFKVVCLNSMHAQALGEGAPQSRDRLYVVFWREGDRAPDIDKWTRPRAHCPRCDRTVRAVQAWKNPDRPYGRYRQQYLWRCPTTRCHTELTPAVRPAADVIDRSRPATRIGDRARPLAEATMRHIRDGLAAHARPTDSGGLTVPDLVLPYYGNTSVRPVDEPLPTVTTVDRHALLLGGEVRGVEDLRFRMLTPGEYAAAMAFPDTYRWQGTKRERVRMAGNAVTPPAARDLVAMAVEALTGQCIEPRRSDLTTAA